MPKTILPVILPYKDFVYDDDAKPSPLEPKSSQLDLSHLAESFQLADLLKELGHDGAAECVRPVRMLSGFKPAAMIQKLHEYAETCSGGAFIVCINGDKVYETIWYPAPNGVNQLVRIALSGGYVLGVVGLNTDGSFTANTEPGPDQPLSTFLLNCFAQGYLKNPQWIAAEELLTANSPDSFEPQNLEATLDVYSAWEDKYRDVLPEDSIQFPASSTESGQV